MSSYQRRWLYPAVIIVLNTFCCNNSFVRIHDTKQTILIQNLKISKYLCSRPNKKR